MPDQRPSIQQLPIRTLFALHAKIISDDRTHCRQTCCCFGPFIQSPPSKSSTAAQVVAVVIFVLIDFALIIIPFAFLELRPEATKAALKKAQDWLLGHARQLMAYTALILGAYLAISALVRLS